MRTRKSTLSSHRNSPALIPDTSQSGLDHDAQLQLQPHPASRADDSGSDQPVLASCKSCNAPLGIINHNAWIRITDDLYLPRGTPDSNLSIAALRDMDVGSPLFAAGCQFQPFACSSSKCSGSRKPPVCLGSRCITTPPDLQSSYRGRFFFRLDSIQLKWESSNSPVNFQVVEDRHQHQQSEPTRFETPKQAIAMASSPPLPAAAAAAQHQHHAHQPSPSEHQHPQKSPSQPLPPQKLHHQAPHQSPREHPSSLPVQPSHSRGPSAQGIKHWEESHHSPNQRPRETNGVRHSNGPSNGQMYSPSQQHHPYNGVNVDAINRLQSQMSLNTATLETQRRDLQRMQDNWAHDVQRIESTIGRLGDDVRGIQSAIDQVRIEVRQRPAHPPPHQPSSDMAVELIRKNLEQLRPKVGEIEDVKIQVEMMRATLARLDKGSQEPPRNGHPSYNSPREMPLHSVPNSHHGPPPRVHTPGRPDGRQEIRPGPGPPYHPHHQHDPAHPSHHPQHQQHHQQPAHHQQHSQPQHPPPHPQHQRPHPHQQPAPHGHPSPHLQHPHPQSHAPAHQQPHAHAQSHPPKSHHHQPPPSQQHGLPSNDLPRVQDAERSQTLPNQATQPSGWVSVNTSSKRGLANGVEERSEHQVQPSSPKRPKLAALEPRVDSNEGKSQSGHDRMETDEQSGSRAQSRDSYGEPSVTPSQFIPYNSNEASEDHWRSESQRVVSHGHDARTSPKRGRGGRGRGRKSLPAEFSTPQWERPHEWPTPQQHGPDNYYHESPSGSQHGVFARRDSNGSLVSMPPGHVSLDRMPDPYAHTKKTRTKPIRNADGVLIRKDGRPDMRSQSSAANLRKVHARKEQEKGHESSLTPTSGLANSIHPMDMNTPSPAPSEHASGHDVFERHSQIMEKVFPHGHDDPLRGHDRSFLEQGSPRKRENVKAEANSSASASPAERMETEAPVPMETEVEDKTMENAPELPKPQAEVAPTEASAPATNAATEAPPSAVEEAPKPVVEA